MVPFKNVTMLLMIHECEENHSSHKQCYEE